VQVSLFVAWDTTKGLATEAAGGPPSFASAYIAPGTNEYVIENITFGTYAALAASWRDTTMTGAAATTTIGAYGADPQAGDNTPLSITGGETSRVFKKTFPSITRAPKSQPDLPAAFPELSRFPEHGPQKPYILL